jgi:hypothetical protein
MAEYSRAATFSAAGLQNVKQRILFRGLGNANSRGFDTDRRRDTRRKAAKERMGQPTRYDRPVEQSA